MNTWQRFNKKLPSQNHVDLWESRSENYNIGLCTGPASGVMAIDVDTDDPVIVNLIPPSEIRRQGRPRREVRFYKFNPKIKSRKFKHINIEIFGQTGQVVLPPSIHPDTGDTYIWLTKMTLEDPLFRDFLTELTIEQHEEMVKALTKLDAEKAKIKVKVKNEKGEEVECSGIYTHEKGDRCPHGSHNRLVKIASALFFTGVTNEEGGKKIYEADKRMHFPFGYFSDNRPDNSDYKCDDPQKNALIFFTNVAKSNAEKRAEDGLPPIQTGPSTVEIGDLNKPEIEINEFEDFVDQKKKSIELPPLTGFLKELAEDIVKNSNITHPTFTYAGAIMAMATLCLGRYTLNGQWTNLFALLLGEVSAGKSSVMSYNRQLFKSVFFREHHLDSKNGFGSNIAMIQDLPKQRYRLDTVDEGSSSIRACADRKALDWAKFQLYTELWSGCGQYFGGIPAVTRAESYACDSPAINLLYGCQTDTMIRACTSDLFELGFIPRCLIFSTEEEGTLTKNFTPNMLDQELLLNLSKRFPNDRFNNGKLVRPIELAKSREVKEKILEMRMSCHEKVKSISNYDRIEKTMYTKVCENTFRLAPVLMASEDTEELKSHHIDTARHIVEALLVNSINILNRAGGTSYSKDLIAIENCIKSQPGVIKLKDVSSKFRHIPVDRKNAYYRDLEDQGKIKIERTRSGMKLVSYIG